MPRGNTAVPSPMPITQAPRLPAIECPQGALAEAHQRRSVKSIMVPRGILQRMLPSTPTTCPVPHDQSAMWFKELYSGFMAAQMIGYAANAIDILKLLAAETTELAMASSKSCVPDDSLEPRKVGIWVLACPPDQYSTEAQTMLDALSAWSQHQVQGNRVVSHVRMSALFGTDATFFMEQIASECTVNTPIDTCGIRILLRWHDGTKTRAVWRDIASHVSVLSGACAVRELQDTVVRISGEYDVQLPVVCMKPAADVVPPQAFYHTIRAVSTEFFNMLEGANSSPRTHIPVLFATLCTIPCPFAHAHMHACTRHPL